MLQLALLPPICVLCGDTGSRSENHGIDLCRHCQAELPRLTSGCARCAEPLSGGLAMDSLCGRCQVTPPSYNRCISMFSYLPPAGHMIQSHKFQGSLEIALLLGTLMAEWLSVVIDLKPDVLIPVPLHMHRLRERGFNQAAEIAKPIARQLGCDLDVNSCRRIKTTDPQSGLNKKDRVKNVRGAFEVLNPIWGRVAIIDDVMTTGSTANEFAKTLIKAGAESVDVWVCARA